VALGGAIDRDAIISQPFELAMLILKPRLFISLTQGPADSSFDIYVV
jgi:hypothetical protein